MKRLLLLSIISLILPAGLMAQSLSDSLLFLYQFDGDATDQSGNGYDGTIMGATSTTDRFGNPNSAYSFDGAAGYIEIPGGAELRPDFPVTVSFWMEAASLSASGGLFGNEDHGNNYFGFFITHFASGQLLMAYGDGGGIGSSSRRGVLSSTNVTAGQWYHVTAVYEDASTMTLYIDCQDVTGAADGTGMSVVGHSIPNTGSIGRKQTNNGGPSTYFDGKIDEVAMWHRALTPAEITDICNGALTTEEMTSTEGFSIFPNPAEYHFVFESNTVENGNLTIMNAEGKLVRTVLINSNRTTIDASDLAKGLYMVRFTSNEGQVVVKKMIVK